MSQHRNVWRAAFELIMAHPAAGLVTSAGLVTEFRLLQQRRLNCQSSRSPRKRGLGVSPFGYPESLAGIISQRAPPRNSESPSGGIRSDPAIASDPAMVSLYVCVFSSRLLVAHNFALSPSRSGDESEPSEFERYCSLACETVPLDVMYRIYSRSLRKQRYVPRRNYRGI